MLGWVLISGKGDFDVGDKCVFFEIDSKLPEKEWSEFMRKKHFKVKTMKIGKFKVISQGLALPLDVFDVDLKQLEIGSDVTDILGVKYSVDEDNIRKANSPDPEAKYRSMAQRHQNIFKKPMIRKIMKHKTGRQLLFIIFGRKKDNPLSFPTHFQFIHKTDEERVENMPWVLNNKNHLIVTEKLDGTSSTYILERKKGLFKYKYEFYVLSRNVRQINPSQQCYHEHNIYWEMAKKYHIYDNLKKYLDENPELSYACIQGESIGNVQGNPLKIEENQLYIFNFINSSNGLISPKYAKPIIESWGMQWVPIIDTSYVMPDTMEEFKEYATAKSKINPEVLREGVVLRDYENGLSFKNVSREYLLNHNE